MRVKVMRVKITNSIKRRLAEHKKLYMDMYIISTFSEGYYIDTIYSPIIKSAINIAINSFDDNEFNIDRVTISKNGKIIAVLNK